VRAETLRRQERIGKVRGIVIDAEIVSDPSARLDPPYDRVAIAFRQSGVCGYVVHGCTVGEQSPTLGSTWMLARESKLFRVDHHAIVRRGIRSAPRQTERDEDT
jgi:hypothetical protein